MKKRKGCLALPLIVCLLLTGCGAASANQPAASGQPPASPEAPALRIVATTFPQYDWVRQILGPRLDFVELTLLADDGVDLHSFQPTVEDIARIGDCDLLIYVGGVSDAWVDEVLINTKNEDRTVINLMEVLGAGVKTEEIREGMEEDGHEGEEDEDALDEHVWLSLKNARLFCARIAETLGKLDPDHADTYEANLRVYVEKLAALDGEYQAAVEASPRRVLLFGDRFPFRYLVDDYGLDYYAAFPGCYADTEASFETIVFLARKTEELGLSCVMAIEGSDCSVAETVVSSTKSAGQAILVLDSMQSVTREDLRAGISYLSVMEQNLAVLKQALQ